MKIIVTGSLGNIGKPLALELISKGYDVTVISSDPRKKKEIENLGANAAIGTLANVDFLTSAFTGGDALFTMVPPNFKVSNSRAYYNSIANNLTEAIQRSGIKQVVNLSSWGAHLDKGTGFIVGAYDVEAKLNGLPNVGIVHLRAGFIYYNLYRYIDMIKTAGFIGTNFGGEDKIVMAAPVDIAIAAAEELVKTHVIGSTLKYVASDDRTANEIASVLGTAIGIPDLKWLILTDEEVKNSMEKLHIPADIVTNFVQLHASIHSGAMREDYDLHRPSAMGKIKLEDFAKEFAAAF